MAHFPTLSRTAALALAATFGSGALADEIRLTDQADREVVLPGVPERIATIATPAGSMVVTLSGAGETLVGTSPNSRNALMEGVLHEFFPALENVSADIISKEGAPNIEELLKLETDLVVQWARKDKSIEAMEAAGLTVAGLRYKKIDIARTWLSDLGIMLDQEEKAARILAWHDEAHARIIARTGTIPEEEKPSVLYMMSPNRAAGPNSHFQFFMDTAGAVNALDVDASFADVDPEMLMVADPDIIWLFGFNMTLTPQSIYENPLLADLTAVKNKRVYKVPVGGDRWDPPNQEFPLGQEWFTRTVHPELLDGSIRDSIRAAYPMLYGHTPNDAQLAHMLRAEMNADARDYARIIR